MSTKEKQQRIIGRWTLGETLETGGYSWVKIGQDIKTGKIVHLKFMEKAHVSWVKQQAKQVDAELEALKNIRHKNVLKLYAYNVNAQYPLLADQESKTTDTEQKYIDIILLVLDNVTHSELFDVLYYTSVLKEKVARTFFKHIINGLEACHNAGVVHRNINPSCLALDKKYNVKISDFGLSKIIHSDDDAIMKTTYVGTRGYQAPEILLNQKYDLKCDIFSVGVILFILLAGYPPFENASKNDKWYKPLIKGNVEKFWKAHQKSPIAQLPDAEDLLTKMLWFDAKQRIDINGIKSHKWFKGETLRSRHLMAEIRDRHRKAEKKRRQDVRKMNDLYQSLNPNKPIPGIEKAELKLFPKGYTECMFGEAYTYLEGKNQKWYDLYNLIEEAVVGQGKGKCTFDFDKGILSCEMSVAKGTGDKDDDEESKDNKVQAIDVVKFDVEIFESRLWQNRYMETDKAEQIAEMNVHKVFVVRVTRTEGDSLVFNKLKNGFILTYCSSIIQGLPDWAQKLEKQDAKKMEYEEDSDESKDNDSDIDDNYDKEIGDYFAEQNKGGIQINKS